MGDRAYIVLTEQWDGKPSQVFLYTHWSGYRIEAIAAEGLEAAIAAGRATDPAYGGRIVTDVFLKHHADSPELGAGVSATGGAAEHIVEINFSTGQVTFDPARNEYGPKAGTVTESFEDFVSLLPSFLADA